jgi:hypothetical protein
VTGNDPGTLRRAQVIVRIITLLILDEIFRRSQLSNVMVKRSDARQQRIGADRASGFLGQLAHCV